MQVRSTFVVSVVSVLGALACGDDEGSTGGVSNDAKLGDVSGADARAVCRNLESKFKRIGEAQTDILCVARGVASSEGDERQCNSAVEQCRDAREDTGLDCNDSDDESGVSSACNDVTVGELNDCLDAMAEAVESVAQMLTCRLDTEGLEDVSLAYDEPASCTAIMSKCPDIMNMGMPE
jgi:hypothetical protein